MLLVGEGGPKNTEEGVMWLERAGELAEYQAFRLLVDYANSHQTADLTVNKPARGERMDSND
jgi:hypothetical protein